MEQMHHQWVVEHQELEQEEEEKEDAAALVRRKSTGSSTSTDLSGHSNGASLASVGEPHTLKEEEEVEETSNVVENGNLFNNDNFAAVVEFVGTAENGEAIKSTTTVNVAPSLNENSVYFDKQQGMWKCHHCTWTKQFEYSSWKGYPDLLMNVKTMIQHGPCFVCETKGNDVDGASSVLPKTIDDKVPSKSELSPIQNSSEIQAKTVDDSFGDENSAKTYPNNLMKEIDQKLEELDVEAVLEKQETHDLFCPNCHSCITKRVILRKRKRNTANLDTKAKRDKSETQLVDSSVNEAKQGGDANETSDVGREEPPADNFEPEREAEVFRCLSCFSFFIPFRNGIKLFPNFGGNREPETSLSAETPSTIATSNANWFFTIFTPNKGKKAKEQADASIENSITDPAEQLDSSSITNVLASPGIGNPESPLPDTAVSNNAKLTTDIKDEHVGANSQIPSKEKSVTAESCKENGNTLSLALVDQNDLYENSSDVMNGIQKIGMDFKEFSTRDTENVIANVGGKNNDSTDMIKTDIIADMVSKPQSVLLATVAATKIRFNAAKPSKEAIIKSILEKSQKNVGKTSEIVQKSYYSLNQEAQSPAQSLGSAVVANDVASDKKSLGVIATIPSDQDFEEVLKDIEEEINSYGGKEKKEALKSLTSQTAVNDPVEGGIVTETHTQIYIGEQPRVETVQPQEWEILKSIVYGGLIESITSLGIVSSAAGSGSPPLNIIAMGLANLIGGLFVISHDLIELKNGHSEGASQQTNTQQDRYQELLGRRSHYLLHAIVAVLSFLIFGSVPLVIYGLLINKNYYDEVKIAVVIAVSMVYIILLAIGKVYTTRPQKSYMKTVLQYVTMGIAASGISFIAGDFIKVLLEKFNHSESGFVLGMNLSGTRRIKPAWMSY